MLLHAAWCMTACGLSSGIRALTHGVATQLPRSTDFVQVVLLGFHATSEEALLGNYYGVPRGGVTSFEVAFQVQA